MSKHLLEAATLLGESASEDGTWKVRLISEGRGSSGIYTADLLENHHHALDNILSFKNHPVGWDGPQSRDFTMIAGEIVGETWIERDERGLTAIMGNFRPDPEHADKLSRYKEKLGLSIYIEGNGYEDANGDFIVDWLNPADPYASVDVVIAAGARGKFMESMQKFYDARTSESSKKPSSAPLQENGKIKMDEELKEALKGITDALAVLVAKEQAKVAEAAQVEADEEAVVAAVEAYDAQIAAIDAADLTASQVAVLRAEAKAGRDVAPLIEAHQKLKAEIVESVKTDETEALGRSFGSLTETKFGAWK